MLENAQECQNSLGQLCLACQLVGVHGSVCLPAGLIQLWLTGVEEHQSAVELSQQLRVSGCDLLQMQPLMVVEKQGQENIWQRKAAMNHLQLWRGLTLHLMKFAAVAQNLLLMRHTHGCASSLHTI